MMYPLRLSALFILLVLAISSIQCGKTDSEPEANRLFVEAYRLSEQASGQELEDPVEAYRNYRRAVDNIDEIIENHSATSIAVEVSRRQSSIGDMTIGELREKTSLMEARAGAMQGYHQLALYLTGRMNDEVARASRELDYAQLLYRNDHINRFEEIVQQITDRMNRHWNTEITDPVFFRLSLLYTEIGEWERSLEAADRIQHGEYYYRSLSGMITHGIMESGETVRDRFISFIEYAEPVRQVRLLSDMAGELIRMNERETAADLFKEHLPQPVSREEPDHEHIEALIEAATLFAGHREFDISRELIERIRNMDAEYVGFAERNLASELARHRQMDKASEVIHSLEGEYFRNTAISAVAVHRAGHGRVSDGLAMLDEIPSNVTEKVKAALDIAYILAEFSDVDRSDSLLAAVRPVMENIDSSVRRAGAVIRIAEVYEQQNKPSLAADALEQAESLARSVSATPGRNSLLKQVSLMWLKLGRPDRVQDAAVHFNMEHDSFEGIMTDLLRHAVQYEYHDLARSLAAITEDRSFFLYKLNSIYLDHEMTEQSMQLSYNIRNYYWRSRALGELSLGLVSAGRETEAHKSAGDALLTLQRIRDKEQQEEALTHVSIFLSATGITMNDEKRSLSASLIGRFDL